MNLRFRLSAHRFEFRAIDSVYFPPGKAGNVLRGAFGLAGFALKKATIPPSGFDEPPRPFVLRATHLEGKRFAPDELFSFNAHIFDLKAEIPELLENACAGFAQSGLGPRRGRAELLRPIAGRIVECDLSTTGECVKRIRVLFRTPTDLKGNPSREAVPFGILFARIRDRVSTLRHLYGEGPLPVDFAALGERADRVQTARSELRHHEISRRSSRSGLAHGIGGFTGVAEYEGDLEEFLPYLRCAWWTGVGRHTVWGNGAIEVDVLAA